MSPEFLNWFDAGVVDDAGKPLVLYHGSKTPQDLRTFQPGGVEGSRLCGDAYGVGTYFTSSADEASNPVYTGEEGAVLPVYITGAILDLDQPTAADLNRLTGFANEILLPADKARFAMGRQQRTFDNEADEPHAFFDAQLLNWEQFGDGMDRARPEVISHKDGRFVIEYTDFDARISLENGHDLLTLFKAIGFDNVAAAGYDGLRMHREGGQLWVVMYRPDGNVKSAIGNSGRYDRYDADITDRADRPLVRKRMAP